MTEWDIDELRHVAENDGETEGIVYIGGPSWQLIRDLLDVLDAARVVSYTLMPPLRRTPSGDWYKAMDRLLKTTERFTNFGDLPENQP